jgi:hypothetical protein
VSVAARKPNALTLVLDLTNRLAADYAAVPVEMITSCVQHATSAVRLFGDDVADVMATVESLARADLSAIMRESPVGARTRASALAS